jgi:phosphopentomutase
MGLGNIDGVDYLPGEENPRAAVARLQELSMGKDTTVGHWELAGVVSKNPLPTYPDGFPEEIISEFEKATGRGVLCNKAYSGTEVIKDYGEEHLKTGKLIVYTSADSVFQIAAEESIVPPETLYEYCRKARKILTGRHGVGRVIARPFVKENGTFRRTENRRDFSLEAPGTTVLDALAENGLDVIAVGKITDIFASRGISKSIFTHGNEEAMKESEKLLDEDFRGLAFINLVDFDMLYGHRQDIDGYAGALTAFDRFIGTFTKKLKKDDLLIITADHGCDPGDNSTDHTREYVPLLITGAKATPKNLGTLSGFGTVANLISRSFGIDFKAEKSAEIYENIVVL